MPQDDYGYRDMRLFTNGFQTVPIMPHQIFTDKNIKILTNN